MARLGILLMALCALLGVACGKKAPPPPEPAPVNKPAPKPVVNTPKPVPKEGEKPRGKSYKDEYVKEKDAAFAAKKRYDSLRRDATAAKGAADEHYLEWAEHMFSALTLAKMHEKSGYSPDSLPELHELKRLKAGDFKNALGPMDDPRVKAAMKKLEDADK